MATSPTEVLATTGWLSEQPAAFRDRVLAMGRMQRLPRGRSIYETGDTPDAIFGLGGGQVDISLPISAEEEVVIHRAGPGFWVGDSALLAGSDRAMTVTAASDCDIFRLPGPAVRAHLAATPDDWPRFFRLTHRNAVLAIHVLAEVLALPPRARLVRALLRLAGPDGVVTATQEELSRMAGMSRASFRRAMAELIADAAVRTGYGTLVILDRVRLKAEAEA